MTTPDPATPPPAAPESPAPPPPQEPPEPSAPTQTPGTPATAKIGEPCGVDGRCAEGTCVSYFGIAGARGPELKSCEIKCDDKTPCPTGRNCVTIADGPGQVCR